MLHGHGDNGYQYGRELIADFSSNVWYGGEPEGLKEHLFKKWERINRYPEPLAQGLAEKVGKHHGLGAENILITSGATESIYLMAQLFRNKSSCILIPSFSEYEDACRIHGHELCFLDRGPLCDPDLSPRVLSDTDLFWIGNPNNPTGDLFPGLEEFISRKKQGLFVIDESFIEFTEPIPSLIGLTPGSPRLAVLRSLTKSFAIPGLRLGYIAAHRDIIEKLQAIKLPWSVNVMALEAGDYIFGHYSSIRLPLAGYLQEKRDFTRQLAEAGIRVYPSDTHFFLCETTHASAGELKSHLLDEYGLLIRDAGNFRGLGPRHFRLATLDHRRNQLLVNAIKEWQKNTI